MCILGSSLVWERKETYIQNQQGNIRHQRSLVPALIFPIMQKVSADTMGLVITLPVVMHKKLISDAKRAPICHQPVFICMQLHRGEIFLPFAADLPSCSSGKRRRWCAESVRLVDNCLDGWILGGSRWDLRLLPPRPGSAYRCLPGRSLLERNRKAFTLELLVFNSCFQMKLDSFCLTARKKSVDIKHFSALLFSFLHQTLSTVILLLLITYNVQPTNFSQPHYPIPLLPRRPIRFGSKGIK